MTESKSADHTSQFGSLAKETYKAERDISASNPGPQNQALIALNPNSAVPPPTDHGVVEPFWYSFELTHRRIQDGGWTHQVTTRELPVSKDMAGVNMRLTKGSFRELHWHLADEWAIMLTGKARITVFTPDGSMFVDDVEAGDLWLFPAGAPHSIQALGDDGCEFLLVFNQGNFSEESTLLLSDWLKHTPPEILQQNFRLGADAISKLPKGEPLYIFPSEEPVKSLSEEVAEAARYSKTPQTSFTFKASSMKPTKESDAGSVKIIDSRNFPASEKIAAAIVTVKPGCIRELHWHPNGSEWQYWIKGKGRMTVFPGQEAARTMDFNSNDVGFVSNMAGHYIENTGDEDLVFLEMFVAPEFQEISLNQWMRALPEQALRAHTNLSSEEVQKIPTGQNPLLR
ncbi:cupin domain-containing protein [Aliirhizobium cellulosilyticum]|uniref:Oxalate decarboxylase n=1 Tax=Aliirhizobium cellulosilyticum TaxID=393664 RepID=A0A7W6Y2F7_9HYPH|nr:cupin domain-containing protein [Rhizobium cellulosilyticum]MBB4349374.1 oxalate decarboxylase [Rhizobium cellulosilyticum]MBB4412404.1 oxalate decarboxylase [Rhizobium cellulosilyticum]MBB4447036.1 oxalate decarboxylase [Rhizobium cellulosilyticum]